MIFSLNLWAKNTGVHCTQERFGHGKLRFTGKQKVNLLCQRKY